MIRSEKKNTTASIEMQLPTATASNKEQTVLRIPGLRSQMKGKPLESMEKERTAKRKEKYEFLQIVEFLVLSGHDLRKRR